MSQFHRRRTTRSSHTSEYDSAQSHILHLSVPTAVIVKVKQKASLATGFINIYEALTPRQIGIITIGSAIGTGLMIGTGRALSLSGPAAIMISYSVVGFTVYLVLLALGEVAAWLQKPCTVADHALRFSDPALGFSLGWIYWLKYAIITPNQLTAAALVIQYWLDAQRVNAGVWIAVFLFIIIGLNCLHHGLPSYVEFYVASFKLLVMFALMVTSLVIALGGADHDRRGFRYWQQGSAFGNMSANRNHILEKFFLTGRTMSSATFAYIGSERSGILYPNVQQAISRSIKHTFYRIFVFHLVAITLLGMIVPPALAFSTTKRSPASPFVSALLQAHFAVVPDILNGCILLFVLSIANFDLYLATKAMCDLSLKHRAPSFLSHVNHRGIPVYALATSVCMSMIAFFNVIFDSSMVFGYFMNTVTMLGLLTWVSILITHVSFVRARRHQGISEELLIFRARFGLVGTWSALVLCLFIAATMTFDAFKIVNGEAKFNYRSVIASYAAIPLFLSLIAGHKLMKKSKWITPGDVDMWTGRNSPAVELAEVQDAARVSTHRA
ncbi:hypothetical protein N7495_000941 [Penicillium taxi]|uniref:uncharacterized protein n=1 Tax=Penicillium taxi TaxID=168475 RepID=UPI002545A18D|nr:uncharacterized protein N7495_000941 [Penicillium taxi]KAJ5908259.1 hypothetical protein N7495_000941 [Penicillium taxi]